MLYAVVGEGAGNKSEIIRSLEDLQDKAATKGEDFWFILHGKEEPTTTDQAILKWLQDGEVYFDVVGEEYEGAQNVHGAKDQYRKLLALMTENKDDGVALLTLFVDTEAEAEEDNELATLVERAVEEEIPVFLLNGQMVRLTFDEPSEDGEGPVEAEAETEPGAEEPVTFTEAELKKMTRPELQAIARGQGLDPSATKPALVAALLAQQDGGVALEEAVEEAAAPAEEEYAGGALLNSPKQARQAATIVVFVDGVVTVLPCSVGHARAVLAGK